MKVITNTDLIEKRKKQASIITPIAMVALVGGLITNFYSTGEGNTTPALVLATIALLAIGFVAATISAHMVNHWVKEPRPDQVLTTALKGFDNRHMLFNHTTAVPHILLSHNTVYALSPKLADGEITVTQRKWKRKFKFSRFLRFFGEEGLGNPTVEAEQQLEKLNKLVRENIEDGDDIPLETIIVFTAPSTTLTINDTAIPVVLEKALKKHLRQKPKGSAISHEHRIQLIELFQNKAEDGKA